MAKKKKKAKITTIKNTYDQNTTEKVKGQKGQNSLNYDNENALKPYQTLQKKHPVEDGFSEQLLSRLPRSTNKFLRNIFGHKSKIFGNEIKIRRNNRFSGKPEKPYLQ